MRSTDTASARAILTLALVVRGLLEIINTLGHPWAQLAKTLLLAALAVGYFAAAQRSHDQWDAVGMTVQWPLARQDARDAPEGLADAQWAARKAADESLAVPDYFLDIGNAINLLGDLTDPPEKAVGLTLRDDEEAALIRAVFDAFGVVVTQVEAQGGRGAPDSAYYAATDWAAVHHAAARALQRMNEADSYETIPGLEHIYLEDPWVLGLHESDTSLSFDLDAVLTEQHPQWEPRKPDEQHTYRRLSLTFPNARRTEWLDRGGPPATDATGELDWGHIDTFVDGAGVYELTGNWGHVRITSDAPQIRDR